MLMRPGSSLLNVRGKPMGRADQIGDKRQFTIIFAISASGKFPGRFQLIWNTLPRQGVMDSFKDDVFHDTSESHWSVEDTIKNYVTKLHDDYIRP